MVLVVRLSGPRARWAWHLDEVSSWLACSAEEHYLPCAEAHSADRQDAHGWLIPHWPHRPYRRREFLGGLVVAADVTEAVAERARHTQWADDLLATAAAFRALKPVSHGATPVPLHAGHLTHRRFLNFSPFPVSHQPPLPSQPMHGFGFGSLLLAMPSACALVHPIVNASALLRATESSELGVPETRFEGWSKAVAAAGLSGFHFHDLRHTGNQMASEEGASLSSVRVMGPV
jgi:hypothetical protein